MQNEWRPRWYYIMVNKTSGMKYVGQTTSKDMSKYRGSGSYWIKHCKKHGGWNRSNIEVVEQVWVDDEELAFAWLAFFEKSNPEYWLKSNFAWANQAKENTQDSALSGIDWNDPILKDKKKEIGRLGGLVGGRKNAESGQVQAIGRLGIGGKKGGKVQGPIQGKKNVESGLWKKVCSLGGKKQGPIQGKKNVESGQFKKFCSAGGKVGGKKAGLIAKDTGQLAQAVALASEGKILRSAYCKLHGIAKPGKGFKNINQDSFHAWKNSLSTEQKMCYIQPK